MRVIAGTSPLHYLVLIDHPTILPALFRRVLIPPAVAEELQRPRTPAPVRAWMGSPPAWLEVRTPCQPLVITALPLGAGEREAISLAQDLRAELLLMYVAQEGGKVLVVIDGQERHAYDGLMRGSPVFSPDSKRIAYAAVSGKNVFAVVDTQSGKAYANIAPGTLSFSPDSKRMAYGAQGGQQWFVVVDARKANLMMISLPGEEDALSLIPIMLCTISR